MKQIDPSKQIRKKRSEEEIHKSLRNCIHRHVTMCVPPQIDDDDIVLYDAFRELVEARRTIQEILVVAQDSLGLPEVVVSEDPWAALLEVALEDIVELCQKQNHLAEE